jgi:hypothetical protein
MGERQQGARVKRVVRACARVRVVRRRLLTLLMLLGVVSDCWLDYSNPSSPALGCKHCQGGCGRDEGCDGGGLMGERQQGARVKRVVRACARVRVVRRRLLTLLMLLGVVSDCWLDYSNPSSPALGCKHCQGGCGRDEGCDGGWCRGRDSKEHA